MTDDRIKKLPKWAQDLIAQRAREYAILLRQNTARQGKIDKLQAAIDNKVTARRIADLDRRVLDAANKAITEAIVKELVGYKSPLSLIVERVISAHDAEIYNLVDSEVVNLLTAGDFRASLKEALNAKLARVLIQRMGGELEKTVNELKANPATRAKITLAITGIIDEITTR